MKCELSNHVHFHGVMTNSSQEAEEAGYTSEDVSIALTHCGDKNPLEWLRENWRHMVDTVSTLATNYGQERRVNDVGSITAAEARVALRVHKGNIWAAVTECVEQRQKKVRPALPHNLYLGVPPILPSVSISCQDIHE